MLRYPVGAGASGSDYVTFTPTEYKSNAALGGERGLGPPPNTASNAIALYMPNSTPNISNPNDWGRYEALGPVGAFKRDASRTFVRGVQGLGGEGNISGYIQDLGTTLSSQMNLGAGANGAKQLAIQQMQDYLAGTPNELLAMELGEVYNPNVELLYKTPRLRQFSFAFDFLPRNLGEAQVMNQIIRRFKESSAPEDLSNGMFKVPEVWYVRYMNRFKPAACENVSVVANNATDMHVSNPGGIPIQTTLTLQFIEIDVITKQDHQRAPQGF